MDTSEDSEVNMDESAGFEKILTESRGSELMESLHKVCVHNYNKYGLCNFISLHLKIIGGT